MSDRDLFIATASQALGVPASTIDAHLRTETGDGSKTVGAFNYGNIKAGAKWAGPTTALNALEYDKAGNPIKEPSRFRAYADAKSAGQDYANLLLRKYPGTFGAQSAEVFAAALKAGGYATDPKYVQKFLSVAGGSIPAATAPAAQAKQVSIAPPTVLNPDPLKEEMPDKTRRSGGGSGLSIPPLTDINLPPDVDLAAAARVAGDAAQAKVASTDYSLLEQARRASDSSGLMGAITRTIADLSRDSTVDPLYKTDPKKLVGLTESEQEHVIGSTSLQDEEYRLWQIKDRKESAEIVAAKGAGRAFLAGTLSELPVGFGVGIAASRAFAAMRSAGLVGGGYGTLAAEGFAASSVVEVLQAQIDPWWSKDDAIANVVLGTALEVGLGSALLAREGKLQRRLEETQAAVMDQRLLDQQEAARRVGPDADPEVLAKEVEAIRTVRAEPPEVLPEQAAPVQRWDEDTSATPGQVPHAVPAAAALSRQQPGLLARAMQTLRSLFRSTPGGDGMGRPDTSWQGWDSATVWEHRARDFGPNGKNAGTIERMTFGQYKSFRELDALPAGIHLQAGRDFTPHLKSLETLRKKFLGEDMRIVLADADPELKALNANGAAIMLKENLAIIHLDLSKPLKDQIPVLLHEVGHAVWQKYASKLTPRMRADIDRAYQDFLHASGREQARMRYANYNKNATVNVGETKYELSRDEFSAEQFVKFIEDDVLRGSNSLRLERSFAESLVAAVMKMLAFFKEGLAGFRRADVAYGNLFESILDKQSAMQQAAKQIRAASAPSGRSLSVSTAPDDGLNLAPNATAQQGAEAKFIAQLYEEARSPGFEVDERRLSTLYNTALFQGAQSNTNTLLRSENPVARMFAAKFMESPSGAAGRRANPAIAKTLHERAMLGNAVNEVQAAYRDYRQAIGGSVTEDTFGGKHWDEFNRAVAREIEARGNGSPVQSPASVKQAADALEKAYERALKLQVSTKTTGWANLPANSRGYMPHRLSKDKLLTAKPKEFGALHDALTDQFIRLGMDMSFADQLAAKYVTRAKERALGGFDTPTGAQHVGAAEVVEEALEAMGMSRTEVLDTMKRFMRAGPGHTKARLELDLNKEYPLEDGSTFRLGDFYEYDQLNLLRSQVSRVSGEAALTEFGVPGKAGLDLYRRAFMYGEGRVTQEELGAFDQFAAEMMGMPYGTQSKVVDRMIQANSLARLGGMGFAQAAEAINGMWHLGVGRMMDTIVGIPRLRDEIKSLVRGEAVDNPIVGSVERAYGGAEFGTDSYKTVFPFDNKALEVQAYGQETITLMDRLLRGGGHLQGKLSMWRTLHATQQRGMAEGIVRKAAVYLKDRGEADVWLRDMGLSDTLIQRLRADLDKIAEFDGAGRLAKLDITKTDAEVAREFAQVVWRGVNQIIQGTFPGERNRWATDAHMRLLTQFRTFSLTAVEKQWGRMVGNVGAYRAAGILIGNMCAVLPIYAARVYAGALGRDDADEYIDRAFEPERIARQAMNYTASSGLVSDFLDVLGAFSGVSLGGRTGTQEEAFFGSLVAPSADLLNDLYGAVQNTEEGTSFEALAKSAPFSKLPYVIPAVNVLFAD